MGANTYNISSDNVIYSINGDGSITKIAQIDSNGAINPLGKKKRKNSHAIILYILCLFLFLGLIVSIFRGVELYNDNETLSSKIISKNREVSTLGHKNTTLLEEKRKAEEALAALKSKIGNSYPLIIYDILIANVSYEGEVEANYGNTIYSSNTMYLKPKIKYYGIDSGYKTLKVKWIRPDGSMSSGTSSPYGFSQSSSNYISSGSDNSLELGGWGNSNKGHWSSGTYRIEIWYDNACLKSKSFTIY